jgi:hypothetical protein
MADILNEEWWYRELVTQWRQKNPDATYEPERKWSGWETVSSDYGIFALCEVPAIPFGRYEVEAVKGGGFDVTPLSLKGHVPED